MNEGAIAGCQYVKYVCYELKRTGRTGTGHGSQDNSSAKKSLIYCHTQVSAREIPDGWMGLDIGPDAVDEFKQEISVAETIVWNGPLGVFEWDAFASGTNELAKSLAARTAAGGTTIVGGGDSVAAVEKAGVASQISHISTGGGASLELLEGKELPGIAALDDA